MRALLLLLLLPALRAEDTPAKYTGVDLQTTLKRADELKLAEHPYWHVLLHLAPGITGHRSRVDDKKFFLAATGKHDPRAELYADLAAFFAPAQSDDKLAATNRFPARLEWLCEQLQLDRERLPLPKCAEFEDIYQRLNPRSAAMVFPSAYMNTPASMFGHTLLMIRSQFDSALLSQSINYAAVTTERNGVVFAFKGIFGLYSGYYSLLPYYQKVQEYSSINQRDIWEYDLNFDQVEIRRLLLHVWEMRGIASRYFFFDENCSYNLLYLLDAARPGLSLNAMHSPWIIPLDTVKRVKSAGLIAKSTYRPSLSTRVRALAARLPEDQSDLARSLSLGGTQLPQDVAKSEGAESAAKLLDLAALYLQSLRGSRKVKQIDYQPRLLAILAARSKIDTPPEKENIPAPPAPDRGHESSRLSAGVGRTGDENFAELAFRPAYHDLLDPPDGYLVGSQIEFMSVTGRWYEDDSHPKLERLDALRLRSFTPRDSFYPAKSWKIDTGIIRQQMGEDGDWHRHAYLTPGIGLTYHLDRFATIYGLIEGDLRVDFDGPEASAGAGPALGLIVPLGKRVLVNPYARLTSYLGHAQDTNWQIGSEERLLITRDLALGADISRSEEWDFEDTALSIRCLYYF